MEQPSSTPASRQKPRRDRWVKVGFLAAALVAVVLIWWNQRREPDLDWPTDLPAALERAKAEQRQIVVFFTRARSGRSRDDNLTIEKTLTRAKTLKVLNREQYVRVHLNLRDHKDTAAKYGVSNSPTFLLLDPGGVLKKKHTGFLTDLDFCNRFLGVEISPTSRPGSAGARRPPGG